MSGSVSKFNINDFTKNQLEEIQKGLEQKLNVSVYAKKEFLAIQMQQIRLGLQDNLPVEKYANSSFDWLQMEQIRMGLKDGIDISKYAKPEISFDRMQQIRLSLLDNIDLSAFTKLEAGVLKQLHLAIKNNVRIVPYITQGYDDEQLEAIREALEKKLPVDKYVNKTYRGIALKEIFTGLEHNVDVSQYASLELTWQQMREIRIGLENRVDVSQYKNHLYSAKQMKEIRLGLEEGLDVSYYKSPIFAARDMNKKRLELLDNPKLAIETNKSEKSEKNVQSLQKINISLSPDEMEAYLQIDKNNIPGRINIIIALTDKGIKNGIDFGVVDAVSKGEINQKSVIIARGTPCIDGKDGWYEFFVKTEIESFEELLEQDKINFSQIEWFETVNKDQQLAYYHKSIPGSDGTTVTGKKVFAKRCKELPLLSGTGITKQKDNVTYTASQNGVVTIDGYTLKVTPLLKLKEVSASSEVNFEGNLLIEGDVKSGARIHATEDVLIKGTVESAQINTEGNLILQKEFIGYRDATIRAKKNVFGPDFELVEIYASQKIIGNKFKNCILYAQGQVKTVGQDGMITGGSTCAENGIKTVRLGTQERIPTFIKIGKIERFKQRENNYNSIIRDVSQELFTLQTALKEFQKRFSPELRNKMEMYLKIENAIYTKEREMENILKQKHDLLEEINKSETACVEITDILYEGVTVEIDGIKYQSQKTKGVILKKNGNKIQEVYENLTTCK